MIVAVTSLQLSNTGRTESRRGGTKYQPGSKVPGDILWVLIPTLLWWCRVNLVQDTGHNASFLVEFSDLVPNLLLVEWIAFPIL